MHFNTPLALAIQRFFLFALTIAAFSSVSFAQLDRIERERAGQMLSSIKSNLEKNYYDPAYHGMNVNERFKLAEEKLKQTQSLGGAFSIIAQTLIDLNDSHTFFLPPQRAAKVEYGWKMGIVGDTAYVIAVKPGSDADKKGLKVGDAIISVNGFKPSRSELWKMNYYYYQLSPRSMMDLIIQSPAGEQKQLQVITNVKALPRIIDLTRDIDINSFIRESENESLKEFHRFHKVNGVMIWKMPSFSFDPDQVDSLIQDRIKGNGALILDLRGNGGGLVKTMERLAGYFFDKDTKIADLKGRKSTEVSKTATHGANTFTGQIVVLLDSKSASASEITARLLQIEKRGYVIGDRSAGAVMQSRSISMQTGVDKIVFYGMSVTDADVIMTDGKSVEHVGVTPDELVIPTAADLASGKDPAMARALEKLGVKVGSDEAGAFFPTLWDDN